MPRINDRWNKKHGMPQSAVNLRHKKRTMTTVNDILTRDEVNEAINELNEVKPHVTDLVVIYMDKRDGRTHWFITDETLSSTATWMLESTKLDILNADAGDSDA